MGLDGERLNISLLIGYREFYYLAFWGLLQLINLITHIYGTPIINQLVLVEMEKWKKKQGSLDWHQVLVFAQLGAPKARGSVA